MGEAVSVEGIVTADFQSAQRLNGFFIQSVQPDNDENTSEGLFVLEGASSIRDVNLRDFVRVTGTVRESPYGMTQMEDITALTVVSSNQALPDPVSIPLSTWTPDLNLGTNIAFLGESSDSFQPNFEPYEGMLVEFTGPMVVAEMSDNLQRYNQAIMYAGAALPPTFTTVNAPDELSVLYLIGQDLLRIAVDDATNRANVGPTNLEGFANFGSETQSVRLGDAATVNGVVHQDSATGTAAGQRYLIRNNLDNEPCTVTSSVRPLLPPIVSAPRSNEKQRNVGSVHLSDFIVSNRKATFQIMQRILFRRQQAKIVTALLFMDLDVIGLDGFENEFSAVGPLRSLVEALNTDARNLNGDRYTYVYPGRQLLEGSFPTAVGFIYKMNRVRMVGQAQIIDWKTDSVTQPSLAVSFEYRSGGFTRFTRSDTCTTMLMNSWAGRDEPNPACQGDNANSGGFCQAERTDVASNVATFSFNLTGTPCQQFLVMGRLQVAQAEPAMTVLTNDQAGNFTNLLTAERDASLPPVYDSYTPSGQALSRGALLFKQTTGAPASTTLPLADVWHINADEPSGLDYRSGRNYDGESPVRFAELDPLLVRLEL